MGSHIDILVSACGESLNCNSHDELQNCNSHDELQNCDSHDEL